MGPVLTYEYYTFLFFKTNIFLTNTIIQSTKISLHSQIRPSYKSGELVSKNIFWVFSQLKTRITMSVVFLTNQTIMICICRDSNRNKVIIRKQAWRRWTRTDSDPPMSSCSISKRHKNWWRMDRLAVGLTKIFRCGTLWEGRKVLNMYGSAGLNGSFMFSEKTTFKSF